MDIVSDPSIGAFLKAELFDDFFDDLASLSVCDRRRQPELRSIGECFTNSQGL